MVAKLKLKGIDGRTPAGVEPTGYIIPCIRSRDIRFHVIHVIDAKIWLSWEMFVNRDLGSNPAEWMDG